MKIHELGNADAATVLVQPVSEYDGTELGRELSEIRQMTDRNLRMIAVEVGRWNDALSPWEAPAVFRNERFGGGAADTLREIAAYCGDQRLRFVLGGYSLAGRFSLWAACQTELFAGVAAASPSVWFPGFCDYLRARPMRCAAVSLSLGDREENARSPLLASVGERIRETQEIIRAQGVDCVLEWNPGSHFQEPEHRTAKAFARLLRQLEQKSEKGAAQ